MAAAGASSVEWKDVKFDLEGIARTIEVHWVLFSILALIAFAFWATRPGGLSDQVLQTWRASKDRDARVEADRQALLEVYAQMELPLSLSAPKPAKNVAPRTSRNGRRRPSHTGGRG